MRPPASVGGDHDRVTLESVVEMIVTSIGAEGGPASMHVHINSYI